MDQPTTPNFTPRVPWLPRLLLWVLVTALLAAMLWPPPNRPYQWRLHLAGDSTNLYVVMTGKPQKSAKPADGVGALALYSQMDARGAWSAAAKGAGDVLHAVAWQEDLVAVFADGGMFFFGPSGRGYAASPKAADSQAWQWWLAAAVDESRLLALGLNGQGQPVFSQRGTEAWGDIEPVELKAEWSAETASEMAAAVRQGEFHVLWPTRAVAETPTEQGPRRRWLMSAWRDAAGKWQGPFEDQAILLDVRDGPPSVAVFGDKLAMVYREPAAEGEASPAAGPHLAYAEFTGDRQWHRVRSVDMPPRTDGDAAVTGYGFTRFGKGHVLAVRYADDFVSAFRMDAESGRLEPMPALPKLVMTIGGTQDTAPAGNWLMISLLVMAAVMFIMSQMARRRLLRQRLADGSLPSEEVARIVAAQVDRLMYLPVLVRRVGAVVIDLALMFPPAVVVISQVLGDPTSWRIAGVDVAPYKESMYAVGIYAGVLLVYHVAMEMIWQRTLGKMACGVRVVDLSGRRAAWWRIVLRNVFRPIDAGMIGLLSIVWSRRNQSIGDQVAGTRVVPTATTTSGGPQDSSTRTL